VENLLSAFQKGWGWFSYCFLFISYTLYSAKGCRRLQKKTGGERSLAENGDTMRKRRKSWIIHGKGWTWLQRRDAAKAQGAFTK